MKRAALGGGLHGNHQPVIALDPGKDVQLVGGSKGDVSYFEVGIKGSF